MNGLIDLIRKGKQNRQIKKGDGDWNRKFKWEEGGSGGMRNGILGDTDKINVPLRGSMEIK